MIAHRMGELFRHRDVSGQSGTGVVAQVTQFSNGKAAVAWLGDVPSVTVFDSIDQVLQVHGHNGATVIYWHDGDIMEDPSTDAVGCLGP